MPKVVVNTRAFGRGLFGHGEWPISPNGGDVISEWTVGVGATGFPVHWILVVIAITAVQNTIHGCVAGLRIQIGSTCVLGDGENHIIKGVFVVPFAEKRPGFLGIHVWHGILAKLFRVGVQRVGAGIAFGSFARVTGDLIDDLTGRRGNAFAFGYGVSNRPGDIGRN
jgi:hypothetical protein